MVSSISTSKRIYTLFSSIWCPSIPNVIYPSYPYTSFAFVWATCYALLPLEGSIDCQIAWINKQGKCYLILIHFIFHSELYRKHHIDAHDFCLLRVVFVDFSCTLYHRLSTPPHYFQWYCPVSSVIVSSPVTCRIDKRLRLLHRVSAFSVISEKHASLPPYHWKKMHLCGTWQDKYKMTYCICALVSSFGFSTQCFPS